jgi:hypothetical protein
LNQAPACIMFYDRSLTLPFPSQNDEANLFDTQLESWSTFVPPPSWDDSLSDFLQA